MQIFYGKQLPIELLVYVMTTTPPCPLNWCLVQHNYQTRNTANMRISHCTFVWIISHLSINTTKENVKHKYNVFTLALSWCELNVWLECAHVCVWVAACVNVLNRFDLLVLLLYSFSCIHTSTEFNFELYKMQYSRKIPIQHFYRFHSNDI